MLAYISGACVRYGATTILEDITAQINEGDRIGMIGINGAGKTTLISALLGDLMPDEGEMGVTKGASVGYLKQNSGLDSSLSIMEEMRSVFRDVLNAEKKMREIEKLGIGEDKALAKEYSRLLTYYEAKNGYNIDVEIKKILSGMGFAGRDLDERISVLSGGEKTRLAIARLLLKDPELLILDEPTNHLDFATLRWLEDYLSRYKGAVLIVSHDRYFLDKTVNKIWEIEDRRLKEYKGNYSQYKVLKKQYVDYMLKEYEKQQREIEKMEEYAEKNIARASTAASAKSRLNLLSHIERIEKPRTHTKTPSFEFSIRLRGGNDVLLVKDLPVCVGEEKKEIVKSVDLDIKRRSRLAIVGENGSGKSSLLKILVGINKQTGGEIVFGKDIELGYYDQENKNMTAENTVIEELWQHCPGKKESEVRGLLGRVLLIGEKVFTKVSELSGGERAKLGFALLMQEKSNLLILDEPTNHLDLASREALEEALKEFEGTLVFVSHDRYFIDSLSESILEISGGTSEYFPCGFASYEEIKKDRSTEEEKKPQEKQNKAVNLKQQRRERAKRQDDIAKAEREVQQLDERRCELEALIAQNVSDHEKLSEYCDELEKIKLMAEDAMERWMLLCDE